MIFANPHLKRSSSGLKKRTKTSNAKEKGDGRDAMIEISAMATRRLVVLDCRGVRRRRRMLMRRIEGRPWLQGRNSTIRTGVWVLVRRRSLSGTEMGEIERGEMIGIEEIAIGEEMIDMGDSIGRRRRGMTEREDLRERTMSASGCTGQELIRGVAGMS